MTEAWEERGNKEEERGEWGKIVGDMEDIA